MRGNKGKNAMIGRQNVIAALLCLGGIVFNVVLNEIVSAFDLPIYLDSVGTIAVAAAIQRKFGITVVPHVICSGVSKEDIEYELLDLQFLGISHVLLLSSRGYSRLFYQCGKEHTDAVFHILRSRKCADSFICGTGIKKGMVQNQAGYL